MVIFLWSFFTLMPPLFKILMWAKKFLCGNESLCFSKHFWKSLRLIISKHPHKFFNLKFKNEVVNCQIINKFLNVHSSLSKPLHITLYWLIFSLNSRQYIHWWLHMNPTKFTAKLFFSCSKDQFDPNCNLLNQVDTHPRKVKANTLHITNSEIPLKSIQVWKDPRCLVGSPIPLNWSVDCILKFGGS